jgi:hypothetical protein
MRFNEKQKIIITAGIFLILVGGLGALNYFKFKGRSELLAQLDKFSAEEQALTAKIKQIPDLREKRAKLINIIDQYVEILPKEEHVQHEAFMKIIIKKAENVKKKDDEKSPKQENFIRHRYKFKLLGTVPDFIEFVNKIENHTRFLKVDTIKIRPLGTLEESGEDLGEKPDDDELTAASEPVKEIELTVSTYTYSRGQAKKV